MPININSTMAGLEPYEYNFILRSPNGMMINNILGVFDIDFNPRLETVSNLKLKIAKYITYRDGEIENPVWDYLEEPFLISLNDEITFRIDEVSFSADENNGVTKEVTALSLENEMSSKLVQNFKSTINDEANPQTIDVILNDYLAEKLNNLWKIGNTDGEVMTRLRLVPDTDEKTLYEFFKDVQVAYNCIFKYDSSIDPITRRPKRLIHIYDNTTYKVCPHCGSDIYYQDNYQHCKNPNCGKECKNPNCNEDENYVWSKAIYGLDSGLIITDTNYIKNYNEKFEKPVTRLYVKGADDLDIILANPSGQDYIEDFSYYRNEKYMSPELLEALDRYDVVVKENERVITTARENLNKATVRKTNLLYGNISNIAEDLALVEGWLDKANELFTEWYAMSDKIGDKPTSDETESLNDKLAEANDLLSIVDKWFNGESVDFEGEEYTRTNWYQTDVDGNIQTYGIENLQRLYNVYDERISVIGQLNDKLEYSSDEEKLLNNISNKSLDTRFDGINVSNLTNIRDNIEVAINELKGVLSRAEDDIERYNNQLKNIRNNINMYYATDNSLMYDSNQDKSHFTAQSCIISNDCVDSSVLPNLKPMSSNSWIGIRHKGDGLARVSKSQSELLEDEYSMQFDSNNNAIFYFHSSLNNEQVEIVYFENIFTEELIQELNLFVIEGTYTNDTIGTSAVIGSEDYLKQCEELYKDGLLALKGKHEPLIVVEADVIDFLSCCDCVLDAARIGIGNIIRVQHSESPSKKNNFDNMIFRIVEYSHNPMNNSLSLTLSNTEHFKSDRSSVATLLNKASSTSSVVSISKGSWNRAEQNAVDTIINDGLNTAKTTIQCADNQRSVIDNRGITMGSYVDSESDKQVRLMNTGLYITDDDWNTIKTAITGDGIIANRLIGKELIGKTLKLQASGNDGTAYANFDSTGFSIANGNFSVGNLKTDGSGTVDFKGQGFFVDPDNGVIVRGTNKKGKDCEVRLNPNDETNNGKIIEVVTVDGKGVDEDEEHLYFDNNNNLVVNGDVHCKSLYLSELGGTDNNIIAYIDKSLDHYYVSDSDGNDFDYDEDDDVKISGKYLEGRGLKAYDENGNLRINIDGYDGSLHMRNGYIEMSYETGTENYYNLIRINPNIGMIFTKNLYLHKNDGKVHVDEYGNEVTEFYEYVTAGVTDENIGITYPLTSEDVINFNINDGSGRFSGDIDTKKDVIIGDRLQMCQSNNDGYILFGDYASISGSYNDALKLDAMNGVLIKNRDILSEIDALWEKVEGKSDDSEENSESTTT